MKNFLTLLLSLLSVLGFLASCSSPVQSSTASPSASSGSSVRQVSVSVPGISGSLSSARSLTSDVNVTSVTVDVEQNYASIGTGTLSLSGGKFVGTFTVSQSGAALLYVFGKNASGSAIWLGSTAVTIAATGITSVTVATSPCIEVTGTNGNVYLTGLTSNNITVNYIPKVSPSSYSPAPADYISVGNNVNGLQTSNAAMTYSATTGFYTGGPYNASSWTTGATVAVAVYFVVSGVQTCLPQGTVSASSGWATFTYP